MAHFQVFLEIDKTAGAYSLQIYDYLSQIQRETKAFLLIVRHNSEGLPIPHWQWRHPTLFFFVGLKNRVNIVLLFKPWYILYTNRFNPQPYGGKTSTTIITIVIITIIIINCNLLCTRQPHCIYDHTGYNVLKVSSIVNNEQNSTFLLIVC